MPLLSPSRCLGSLSHNTAYTVCSKCVIEGMSPHMFWLVLPNNKSTHWGQYSELNEHTCQHNNNKPLLPGLPTILSKCHQVSIVTLASFLQLNIFNGIGIYYIRRHIGFAWDIVSAYHLPRLRITISPITTTYHHHSLLSPSPNISNTHNNTYHLQACYTESSAIIMSPSMILLHEREMRHNRKEHYYYREEHRWISKTCHGHMSELLSCELVSHWHGHGHATQSQRPGKGKGHRHPALPVPPLPPPVRFPSSFFLEGGWRGQKAMGNGLGKCS